MAERTSHWSWVPAVGASVQEGAGADCAEPCRDRLEPEAGEVEEREHVAIADVEKEV